MLCLPDKSSVILSEAKDLDLIGHSPIGVWFAPRAENHTRNQLPL